VAVSDDNSVIATVERDGDLVAARDGATGAVRGTVDLASAVGAAGLHRAGRC